MLIPGVDRVDRHDQDDVFLQVPSRARASLPFRHTIVHSNCEIYHKHFFQKSLILEV